MSDANSANIPGAGPLVDSNGRVTQPWYLFFLALMNRTGGSGTPTDITQLTQFATAIEKEANTAVPVQPKPVSITEGVTAIQKPAAPDFSQNMVYQVPGAYITGTSPTISQPNIVGVTNGSNAASGSVGEFLAATATGVSLTSTVPATVVSLLIPAGDWDVWGSAYTLNSTATMSAFYLSISQTAATLGTNDTQYVVNTAAANTNIYSAPTPTIRKSVSGNTTIYLVAQITSSTGTNSTSGYIYARRRR